MYLFTNILSCWVDQTLSSLIEFAQFISLLLYIDFAKASDILFLCKLNALRFSNYVLNLLVSLDFRTSYVYFSGYTTFKTYISSSGVSQESNLVPLLFFSIYILTIFLLFLTLKSSSLSSMV